MRKQLTFILILLTAVLTWTPAFAQVDGIQSVRKKIARVTERAESLQREMRQDRRLWGNFSSESIEMSFPGKPGMTIIIDHKFGDIEIVKGSDSQVRITGEKRVSARNKELEEKFLNEMKLEVRERGSGLEIIAEYPEQRDRMFGKRIQNFGIMYTLEVPGSVNIELENSFGDIELGSLSGDFSIRNGFGKLEASRLEGEVFLRNQFGSLEARDLKGEIEIVNEHGSLTIVGIEGGLEARNQHGETRVDDVTLNIEVESAHGSLSVKRIGGNARLSNSFGMIYCSDIKGIVEVDNNNAKVEVFNTGKDVEIHNSFGSIKVIEIGGNLTIRNQNSRIEIEDIPGDIDIDNSFGSVDAENIGGNVMITNRNGSISVFDILQGSGDAKSVRLETSFAPINITLPSNVSAQLEASTTFGSIRTDFDVSQERSSINSKRIRAELGSGKHRIELESTNASITIRKR